MNMQTNKIGMEHISKMTELKSLEDYQALILTPNTPLLGHFLIDGAWYLIFTNGVQNFFVSKAVHATFGYEMIAMMVKTGAVTQEQGDELIEAIRVMDRVDKILGL